MSTHRKAYKRCKPRAPRVPATSTRSDTVVQIYGTSIYQQRGSEPTIWKPTVWTPAGASKVELQLHATTPEHSSEQESASTPAIFQGTWSREMAGRKYELLGTGLKGPKITCEKPNDGPVPTDPLILRVFVNGKPARFSFNGGSPCLQKCIVLTHHHRSKRLLKCARNGTRHDDLIAFARHYQSGRFILDTEHTKNKEDNKELLSRLETEARDYLTPTVGGATAGRSAAPPSSPSAAGPRSAAEEGDEQGGRGDNRQQRRRRCTTSHPTNRGALGQGAAGSAHTADQGVGDLFVLPSEHTWFDDVTIVQLLGSESASTVDGHEDGGARQAASLPALTSPFIRGLDNGLLDRMAFAEEFTHDVNEEQKAKRLCKDIAQVVPGLSADDLLHITTDRHTRDAHWGAGQQAVFEQLVSACPRLHNGHDHGSEHCDDDDDDDDDGDDVADDGEPPRKRAFLAPTLGKRGTH